MQGTQTRCEFEVTTISKNGQVRPDPTCVAVVFWNQGTSEVTIDNNLRLGPAVLNTVTGHLVGGETNTVAHPLGKYIMHTFTVTFNERDLTGATLLNSLKVQFLTDHD